MRYLVDVNGHCVEVEITGDGSVIVDGRPESARIAGGPGSVARRLVRAGHSREFGVLRSGSATWRLTADGFALPVSVLDPRARALRELERARGAAPHGGSVRAPMPGLVVRVLVNEGDLVREGQSLVVVEAMKMENELRAPAAGRVVRVGVRASDRVEKGAVLVEIA